jgi:hypothetical protein
VYINVVVVVVYTNLPCNCLCAAHFATCTGAGVISMICIAEHTVVVANVRTLST